MKYLDNRVEKQHNSRLRNDENGLCSAVAPAIVFGAGCIGYGVGCAVYGVRELIKNKLSTKTKTIDDCVKD